MLVEQRLGPFEESHKLVDLYFESMKVLRVEGVVLVVHEVLEDEVDDIRIVG